MRQANPSLKVAFVGPHVQVQPDQSLMANEEIDFVVRGEFDHAVVEFARGRALSTIPWVSYRRDGKIVHNPAPRCSRRKGSTRSRSQQRCITAI